MKRINNTTLEKILKKRMKDVEMAQIKMKNVEEIEQKTWKQ